MWKYAITSLALVLYSFAVTASAIKLGEPRVELNDTVTLECPEPGTFLWLLPDQTGVDERTNGQAPSKYQVHYENNTLTISGIELEDDGLFTCVVRYSSNKIRSYFVRLWVVPPVNQGDPWTQYKDNFIIGFAAAGTVLLIITSLFLISTFRWRPPALKEEPRDLYPPELPSASKKL